MEDAAEDRSKDETEESEPSEGKPIRPKREVRIGLGIDIRAWVVEHMRRNKGVMQRLKDL